VSPATIASRISDGSETIHGGISARAPAPVSPSGGIACASFSLGFPPSFAASAFARSSSSFADAASSFGFFAPSRADASGASPPPSPLWGAPCPPPPQPFQVGIIFTSSSSS
jgi:hypothetical protein